MVQKNRKPKKKATGKKKPAAKKAARKTKVSASKRSGSKAKAARKVKRTGKKRASSAAREVRSPEPSALSGRVFGMGSGKRARGLGSGSAGQSGDLQGLSRKNLADSESVEELIEEGQSYEAEAVSAVEEAPEPDQGEVQTVEVPEDDVPQEYLDED